MRLLYEVEPYQQSNLITCSQEFQFCIQCCRPLRKYSSLRCVHLTCDSCQMTFCMYCREVFSRDHFNPFSLNSCKMQNTKKLQSYREQIRIRENIQNVLDTNYQYTTEVDLHKTERQSLKTGNISPKSQRENEMKRKKENDNSLINSSYFMNIS